MSDASHWLQRDAAAMAGAVHAGAVTASALVQASLARIELTDGRINAFTDVLASRALARAAALDAMGGGLRQLPLAGVPFAVKNLFDVQGLRTLAGSKIERDSAPASRDALLVQRMEAAGAVLVGALNMDEYAYGFTTENTHEGPTRNPHDLTRIAGGSSGGSAAAVAAGQVPITLGSDTNGSIRVPSSLCGVFGLKPTFGRLPRSGSYPFVASLDHLGPFARSAQDLAAGLRRDAGPRRRRRRLRAARRRAGVADACARRGGPAHRRARRALRAPCHAGCAQRRATGGRSARRA